MTRLAFIEVSSPTITEAIKFMMETVPHQKDHCFIALPLRVRPLFDTWLKKNNTRFFNNELAGLPPFYTGIACPDPRCGFFCPQFRDDAQSQKEIEEFLKQMSLWGSSDYIIIRKTSPSKHQIRLTEDNKP